MQWLLCVSVGQSVGSVVRGGRKFGGMEMIEWVGRGRGPQAESGWGCMYFIIRIRTS